MAITPKGATQQFVPVKEIRNGIIILKDGGYRGVLICSSINFGLKSADEQHAITLGFQNFLNTLDFSIQIVVNSRRMDLRPYLALLQEKSAEQKTELMRIQLHEYIEFVRSFTDQANIMTKSFYVIVPYAPRFSAAETVGFLRRGNAGAKSVPLTVNIPARNSSSGSPSSEADSPVSASAPSRSAPKKPLSFCTAPLIRVSLRIRYDSTPNYGLT